MSSEAVDELRREMRLRFPQAHAMDVGAGVAGEGCGSGERGIFEAGMFPKGEISEVVPGGRFSGVSLLVAGLLEREGVEEAGGMRMVLVDGADGFDPCSFSDEACGRMLWVRCGCAMEMMKAADLLVRDGNVPLVLLDAMGLEEGDLRRVPASAWWRLKQVAEGTGCRLVVMAARRATVPCAGVRLALDAGLRLEDFDAEREDLLERCRF